MAELLSVQVHVPITKGEDGRLLEKKPPPSNFSRLKKVENSALDTPKLSYLSKKRKPVDLEFKGLTYSVSEGRKKAQVTGLRQCTVCCRKVHVYLSISVIPSLNINTPLLAFNGSSEEVLAYN
ncbi:hypothetical protein LSH36_575g02053 [Paralvinella palmiformis]|uniref:Uncharacterized protein n=1 Tax=Paralvinella palmiformis TaxID=53620 RepID=A0AAD9J7B3_9ANNE|nr:hypothetical protein LSH36_575g02053 [Paralvinella palmiformis]